MTQPVTSIARHLRRGCRVAVADGCGAPTGLGALLGHAARAVGGVHLLLGWAMAAPVDVDDTAAFPDIRTVMSGYAMRGPVRDGRVRYLPTRLGSVPRLLAGAWKPDVLVAALRPGARGLVFGSEVGWMRAAVDAGASVLAEVNHGLPDASDGVPVPEDQVVVVAETDRPPRPFTTNPPDGVALTIAEQVAALIPEGAVVQYGPGTIADAILRAIATPVHVDSGLVGDAVLDLDARGLLRGAPRGAYLAGTQRLYDWADDRPILAPVEVTHDVSRLAAHECFVAVNTALEVDPVGQVNVERVGGQPVGGIGGHADFALGGVTLAPRAQRDRVAERPSRRLDAGGATVRARHHHARRRRRRRDRARDRRPPRPRRPRARAGAPTPLALTRAPAGTPDRMVL